MTSDQQPDGPKSQTPDTTSPDSATDQKRQQFVASLKQIVKDILAPTLIAPIVPFPPGTELPRFYPGPFPSPFLPIPGFGPPSPPPRDYAAEARKAREELERESSEHSKKMIEDARSAYKDLLTPEQKEKEEKSESLFESSKESASDACCCESKEESGEGPGEKKDKEKDEDNSFSTSLANLDFEDIQGVFENPQKALMTSALKYAREQDRLAMSLAVLDDAGKLDATKLNADLTTLRLFTGQLAQQVALTPAAFSDLYIGLREAGQDVFQMTKSGSAQYAAEMAAVTGAKPEELGKAFGEVGEKLHFEAEDYRKASDAAVKAYEMERIKPVELMEAAAKYAPSEGPAELKGASGIEQAATLLTSLKEHGRAEGISTADVFRTIKQLSEGGKFVDQQGKFIGMEAVIQQLQTPQTEAQKRKLFEEVSGGDKRVMTVLQSMRLLGAPDLAETEAKLTRTPGIQAAIDAMNLGVTTQLKEGDTVKSLGSYQTMQDEVKGEGRIQKWVNKAIGAAGGFFEDHPEERVATEVGITAFSLLMKFKDQIKNIMGGGEGKSGAGEGGEGAPKAPGSVPEGAPPVPEIPPVAAMAYRPSPGYPHSTQGAPVYAAMNPSVYASPNFGFPAFAPFAVPYAPVSPAMWMAQAQPYQTGFGFQPARFQQPGFGSTQPVDSTSAVSAHGTPSANGAGSKPATITVTYSPTLNVATGVDVTGLTKILDKHADVLIKRIEDRFRQRNLMA